MYSRTFRSNPGLYSLDASSTSHPTVSPNIAKYIPWGTKLPQVENNTLCYPFSPGRDTENEHGCCYENEPVLWFCSHWDKINTLALLFQNFPWVILVASNKVSTRNEFKKAFTILHNQRFIYGVSEFTSDVTKSPGSFHLSTQLSFNVLVWPY